MAQRVDCVVCSVLSVERPMRVQYIVDTQTLTFQSPTSNDLCLHARLLSATTSSWTSQLHCTTVKTGSVKLHDDVGSVQTVEVSFCVRGRSDVCGQAQNATIGRYNHIIIICLQFLPRDAMHRAVFADVRCPSVCPSLCLSRWCIVSKR